MRALPPRSPPRRTCYAIIASFLLLVLATTVPLPAPLRAARHTILNGGTGAVIGPYESPPARTTRACGRDYGDLLTPAPAAARVCEGGVLRALARGSRRERDGPFDMGNCTVQWFTRDEACDLLQRAGTLVIVGDSLQRHVAQALFSVLSGNVAHGSVLAHRLPRDAPHLLELCSCERAYDDHAEHGGDRRCREASAAFLGAPGVADAGPQSFACPKWSRAHVEFIFAAGRPTPGEGDAPWTFTRAHLRAALERAAAGSRADGGGGDGVFVHFQVPALHVGLRAEDRADHDKYFLDPLFDELDAPPAGLGRLRIACVGLTARQQNAKPEHIARQGNHWVVPHNAWLAEACATRGRRSKINAVAGPWDPWPFTSNATSHDGAHYDTRVNVVLSQILLNAVAEALQGGGPGG